MSDRIIRIPEACHILGLTRASYYRKLQADPHFPKPIKLSERCKGHSEEEINCYRDRLIETRGIGIQN